MKKTITFIQQLFSVKWVMPFIFSFCLFSGGALKAQTTLVAGDIVFTGLNSLDGAVLANEFSFVILRTGGVAAGTSIKFTDNGWNTKLSPAALGSSEGEITWTTSAMLPQFTPVKIKVVAAGNAIQSTSTGSSTLTGLFILSSAGDQVIAYQGTLTSPTFVAGIHFNANPGSVNNNATTESGWDDLIGGTSPYPYTSSASGLPPGLTNGVNAIFIGQGSTAPFTEIDNGVYNCNGSAGATLANIRSAITNRANWTTQNSTLLTIPPACNFQVGVPPTIITQPTDKNVCAGLDASLSVVAANASGVQWQVDGGTGFVNVANGLLYFGAINATLTIKSASTSLNGYKYRVIVSSSVGAPVISDTATLTVNALPAISFPPSSTTICPGSNASLAVTATASGILYQWQVNTGSGFTNLSNNTTYSGVASSILNIASPTTAFHGNQYRVIVSGSCPPPATSSAATLNVSDLVNPVFTSCPLSLLVETGVFIYSLPTASDNCSDVTVRQTAGLSSGSVFPIGPTVNTFEAKDASGNTATCTFTITGKVTTGIKEQWSNSWNIHPNPTSGSIEIESSLANGSSLQVECLDHSGKNVRTLNIPVFSNSAKMNLEELPKGMYLIRIQSGENFLLRKIIVE